ncbi:MAG: hypothetical protein GX115_04115 [Ruminiclostridium sp.]|nr:hypothetical protein [Ruminiclostridium sp.]
MAFMFMHFDQAVPQLAYTGCAWCSSTMGISLCQTVNRGCCSYFPKFYPVELQRMSQSPEGLCVLNSILSHPGTELMDDHILVRGCYDALMYAKAQKEGTIPDDGYIQDSTIFFRTCPFVRPGLGCTLPVRYRTYVCNFFVCREVLENPAVQQQITPYLQVRANYVRFLQWENNQLLQVISDNGLTIRNHIGKVIELLAGLPINQYEFPMLEPIEMADGHGKGA